MSKIWTNLNPMADNICSNLSRMRSSSHMRTREQRGAESGGTGRGKCSKAEAKAIGNLVSPRGCFIQMDTEEERLLYDVL